jgi:hypothetical protein
LSSLLFSFLLRLCSYTEFCSLIFSLIWLCDLCFEKRENSFHQRKKCWTECFVCGVRPHSFILSSPLCSSKCEPPLQSCQYFFSLFLTHTYIHTLSLSVSVFLFKSISICWETECVFRFYCYKDNCLRVGHHFLTTISPKSLFLSRDWLRDTLTLISIEFISYELWFKSESISIRFDWLFVCFILLFLSFTLKRIEEFLFSLFLLTLFWLIDSKREVNSSIHWLVHLSQSTTH